MTECMDTILDKMDYEENEMTFDFQGKITISLENILYIESNLHRLVFYMVGEDAVHYTIYMKLDDIAELLPNKDFCRIHKKLSGEFKICRKRGALPGCSFKWKKSCNI